MLRGVPEEWIRGNSGRDHEVGQKVEAEMYIKTGRDDIGDLTISISIRKDEEELADVLLLEPLFNLAESSEGEEALKIARLWATKYQEIHGHRFIAGNIMMWFFEPLLAEGLILEAKDEVDYLKLLQNEMPDDPRRFRIMDAFVREAQNG